MPDQAFPCKSSQHKRRRQMIGRVRAEVEFLNAVLEDRRGTDVPKRLARAECERGGG
jgi:hypothetical protein